MQKPSSFAKRLRELLNASNMTQTELSKRSGISKSSISRYLKGDWEAKQDSVYAIARVANVNEAWLMGYDVPMRKESPAPVTLPSNILPMPSFVDKPRLGVIACGEPILAEQNIQSYDKVPEWVKCDFTLVCKGDSMTGAYISDGAVVCIRSQPEVEDGQIAAVIIDGLECEATLKRVKYFPDHIELRPENPSYRPLSFWDEEMNRVRVIGRAVYCINTL